MAKRNKNASVMAAESRTLLLDLTASVQSAISGFDFVANPNFPGRYHAIVPAQSLVKAGALRPYRDSIMSLVAGGATDKLAVNDYYIVVTVYKDLVQLQPLVALGKTSSFYHRVRSVGLGAVKDPAEVFEVVGNKAISLTGQDMAAHLEKTSFH